MDDFKGLQPKQLLRQIVDVEKVTEGLVGKLNPVIEAYHQNSARQA